MTRRELREHCFKMLFSVDFYTTGEEAKAQMQQYFQSPEEDDTAEDGSLQVVHKVAAGEKDREYLSTRTADVVDKIEEIDAKIDEVAAGWKTKRMGKVELTILRLAVYEMLYDDTIPEKVSVNEAVELAKKFGGNESPAFVNGVLAKFIPKEEKKEVVADGPQGAIPEGTVLGDGHIKYGLARIDTRLLHGQVATAWTKTINPNRIIVVSDNVAHDALRKSMIEQAAPPGVKANVVPIEKMIQVAKDPRFGATKALLLFETPQDALKAIEGGVDIKELNVGSMAHSQGKAVCTKAIAMGKDDVETFEKLKALGVKFDVRKVPSDSPENFETILNKAKSELK